MRMQVRANHLAHKTVRNVGTHNQDVQEKVRSMLSEAVKIEVAVVDDACKIPASKVAVRPEIVCGSPIAQMGSSARVTEVEENAF